MRRLRAERSTPRRSAAKQTAPRVWSRASRASATVNLGLRPTSGAPLFLPLASHDLLTYLRFPPHQAQPLGSDRPRALSMKACTVFSELPMTSKVLTRVLFVSVAAPCDDEMTDQPSSVFSAAIYSRPWVFTFWGDR